MQYNGKQLSPESNRFDKNTIRCETGIKTFYTILKIFCLNSIRRKMMKSFFNLSQPNIRRQSSNANSEASYEKFNT